MRPIEFPNDEPFGYWQPKENKPEYKDLKEKKSLSKKKYCFGLYYVLLFQID